MVNATAHSHHCRLSSFSKVARNLLFCAPAISASLADRYLSNESPVQMQAQIQQYASLTDCFPMIQFIAVICFEIRTANSHHRDAVTLRLQRTSRSSSAGTAHHTEICFPQIAPARTRSVLEPECKLTQRNRVQRALSLRFQNNDGWSGSRGLRAKRFRTRQDPLAPARGSRR